jgi:hypothetical protein
MDVAAQFKAISPNWFGQTERNHEKLNRISLAGHPRFKRGTL